MKPTIQRIVLTNTIVAATLLVIWMVADVIDVRRGQVYQPSRDSLFVHVGVIAISFFLATWLPLRRSKPLIRVMAALAAASVFTVIWLVFAQFFMIYFHIMIGGYL